jgi:hypothetical protein
LKERDYLEDISVAGRIATDMKCLLQKYSMMVLSGFMQIRIWFNDAVL